jgi:hypothetical protein
MADVHGVIVRAGLPRRRGTVAEHPMHLIHRYRLPGELHQPPGSPRRGVGRRIDAGR